MSNTLNYKKILIYRIGHLGDTLVSLPAFWTIRKIFPQAHLTLLTNVDAQNSNYIAARNILPETGLFDDWLFYPNNLSKVNTVLAFLKLFREIRQRKFDCVFYLMTRNRTLYQIRRDVEFFNFAGIKKIFGTDYLSKNLIEEKAEKPLPAIESESDFFLNCLAADGFRFEPGVKPEMLLDEAEKGFASQWLEKNSGTALRENRLIAVAPGSKWDSKIWAEERFAEVIAELIERNDVFPIVFGGREDREKGNRL
ncbi:MAG TPA: glycosyltransferase family 9 protein, partial [Pyrinomonadaceae bacterium]|nr:glycosyltransferase family 9 protein [Pyrinomonadaceae bacterium]